MAKGKVPSEERIASSFQQLAVSSKNLHEASKDLGEVVCILDAALGRLDIGVSAWHKFAGHGDDNGNYWTRQIGYTQLRGKWGIALRRTSGNEFSDRFEEEVWPFNDAPHWMRIESVGKIPDLFETLIARTEESISKIKEKTNEASILAAAIDAPVPASDSEHDPPQGPEDRR